jgi:hypothetical protein
MFVQQQRQSWSFLWLMAAELYPVLQRLESLHGSICRPRAQASCADCIWLVGQPVLKYCMFPTSL